MLLEYVRRLYLACCSLPWVTIAALYLFAGAATYELGHWPIPSRDDPKYIDMDVFYHAVAYGAVAMVWTVPLVLVAGVVLRLKRVPVRSGLLMLLTGWCAVLIQLFLDPGRLFIWYMD